ncbi:Trp biosynthesis-associated membrane protein [Leifsonia sp. PS1209]|uniref:Trp biosynthesis-associated membrane protein n=1 Tax=Leifsonia sp. PS1209 TaxID=2724914 RepID=UPI001442C045|nr:Trp biosynthesis-associated membrane protein [Leifsonia sp. PS1209]QIZ98918.1 Trp biosynthesis-associated membrane protein [Leifsonia sp. PS1209]
MSEQSEPVVERPVSRRAKYLTLLALLVGSGLALLASTQTWFTVHLTDVAEHTTTLAVPGSAAAPALTALSLAGLALAAALAIAGPAFRIVLALLGLLLGASVLISSISALADALRASTATITTATGVAGSASIARLVDTVAAEFWPGVAVAGGVVLVLASAAVVVTNRLWPGSSRKYQTRFEDEDGTTLLLDHDAEAEGAEDGATVSEDAEARAAADGETPSGAAAIDKDTAIDSWDDLSRGEDPTR